MKIYPLLLLLTLLIGLFSFAPVKAVHIPGGNIAYECVGQDSFLITLQFTRDCSAPLPATTRTLEWTSSCGAAFTQTVSTANVNGDTIAQLCSTIPVDCMTFPAFTVHTYTGIAVLTPICSQWRVAFLECCRATTLNLSGTPALVFDAQINTGAGVCNQSPVFHGNPIPNLCSSQPQSFNVAASDPDGDSLVFSLDTALGSINGLAPYNTGFTGPAPMPTLTINPNTGQLDFNTTQGGSFVIVITVDEYRNGVWFGQVKRDFPITLNFCGNQSPQLINGGVTNVGPGNTLLDSMSIELLTGDTLAFDLTFDDANSGDVLALTTNLNSILPGASFTVSGQNPLTVSVNWWASTLPAGWYYLNFQLEDNPCPVISRINKVVRIKVNDGTYTIADPTVCTGDTVILATQGGTVFNWSVISGDPIVIGTNFSCNPCANPIATPATTTTYLVSSNLPTDNLDTVTINVGGNFTYMTSQDIDSLCLGDTAQLSAVPTSPGTYSILWEPMSQVNSPFGFATGAFFNQSGTQEVSVTISNGSGCVKIESFELWVFPSMSTTANITSTACSDLHDVVVQAAGGVPPYLYGATGVSLSTNNTFTGLNSGSQFILVEDALGCTYDSLLQLPNLGSPEIDNITQQAIDCHGDSTGAIAIQASGSNGPFSYSLNGSPFQANDFFLNLSGGNYQVIVADTQGCNDTLDFVLPEPPLIQVTTNTTPDNGTGNGSLTVQASGGTPPFSYTVSGIGTQSNSTFNLLTPGNYSGVVTDQNGCEMAFIDTVGSSVGIASWKTIPGIRVFPNPSYGKVAIVSDQAQNLHWRIVDLRGVEVGRGMLLPENEGLSIEYLSSGSYWIELTAGSRRAILPLTKL
ncbi:MAG: SprB repeat-containing protein [Salibacteraceae bacterium]